MIGIFAGIALISAVLACANAEAFATLAWLWLLPVSFLGSFLALLLLWCALLLVMAKRVDLNAKYEDSQRQLVSARMEQQMYKERYEQLQQQVTTERTAGNEVVNSLTQQLAEL